MGRQCRDSFPNFFQDVQKVQNLLFNNVFIRGTLRENLPSYSLWVIYDHDRSSKQHFFFLKVQELGTKVGLAVCGTCLATE